MIPRGYYAILYKLPKDEGVGVKFPEHSNIITYGHDWKHAEEMAREALSLTLEADFELGFHLPEAKMPKAKRGERVIYVPLESEVYVAYLLRDIRETESITQKQMAERLKIAYQTYQRMERPGRSNLTVSTLQRLARALNKELVIELR